MINMNVLYINLDRHQVRNHYMKSLLDRFHIKNIRVSAIDGDNLQQSEIETFNKKNKSRFKMASGEIGCFLSHIKCWDLILEKDEKYCLILEDDVIISESIKNFIDTSDWVPHDADIVKVETNFSRTIINYRPECSAFGRNIHRLIGKHASTGAYIISRDIIPTLLQIANETKLPIDQFLFNPLSPAYEKIVTYQLVPALAVQHSIQNGDSDAGEFASSLDNEREMFNKNDETFFYRRIVKPPYKLIVAIYKLFFKLNRKRLYIRVPLDL